MPYTMEERIAQATARGRKAGQNKASWVFDGNTPDATYRNVLAAIEEGAPQILDALGWSPLSGEWAGESIPELLGDLIYGEEEDEDENYEAVTTAYEEAATEAYWDAIEATCRRMIGQEG